MTSECPRPLDADGRFLSLGDAVRSVRYLPDTGRKVIWTGRIVRLVNDQVIEVRIPRTQVTHKTQSKLWRKFLWIVPQR